jgi:hypothetical protein
MQIIPPSDPLMAGLPSGREYHKTPQYAVPSLAEDILVNLRAPPDPAELARYRNRASENDSGSDVEQQDPVGAFPGTAHEYSGSSQYY